MSRRRVHDVVDGQKYCKYHKTYHPISEFDKDPKHYSGYSNSCKEVRRVVKMTARKILVIMEDTKNCKGCGVEHTIGRTIVRKNKKAKYYSFSTFCKECSRQITSNRYKKLSKEITLKKAIEQQLDKLKNTEFESSGKLIRKKLNILFEMVWDKQLNKNK